MENDVISRINQYTFPEPNTGCWLWGAATRDKKGYGVLKVKGKMQFAHRLNYQIHKGEIPKGLFVCHRCDTPTCINPEHLFLGTTQENTQDRTNKGRDIRGEKQWNSKLTDAIVTAIRDAHKAGYKRKDIAKYFGVKYGHVTDILNRRAWTHLD